jgi:hypothetical protein
LSAASITATPALLSRWRETMKPFSRNSGCGSIATMSPTSTPSRASASALPQGVDAQLDMVPADRALSISSPKAWPEAFSGRIVPR